MNDILSLYYPTDVSLFSLVVMEVFTFSISELFKSSVRCRTHATWLSWVTCDHTWYQQHIRFCNELRFARSWDISFGQMRFCSVLFLLIVKAPCFSGFLSPFFSLFSSTFYLGLPGNLWGWRAHASKRITYQAEPDSPVRYVTQSKRPNSSRALQAALKPVVAR